METKTMETKTGHFIDKNYLEKSFINYDKDFLLKKYFLKSEGEEIKVALEEIEAGILENTNKAKLNKYYLNSIDYLPSSAESADYNGIYIVFDSKSADAECKCFADISGNIVRRSFFRNTDYFIHLRTTKTCTTKSKFHAFYGKGYIRNGHCFIPAGVGK